MKYTIEFIVRGFVDHVGTYASDRAMWNAVDKWELMSTENWAVVTATNRRGSATVYNGQTQRVRNEA